MSSAEKQAKEVATTKMEAQLPRGLRFMPTDEEIIECLDDKINGRKAWCDGKFIFTYDLYGKEKPWEIWEKFGGGDTEDLYFYNQLKKKSTKRIDRLVDGEGCWHGFGAGNPIIVVQGRKRLKGVKKIFAYKGPERNKGRWIMHEYSLDMGNARDSDYVICRIRRKMRPGDDNSGGNQKTNLLKRRKTQTVTFSEDISNENDGLNEEEPPELIIPEIEGTDTSKQMQIVAAADARTENGNLPGTDTSQQMQIVAAADARTETGNAPGMDTRQQMQIVAAADARTETGNAPGIDTKQQMQIVAAADARTEIGNAPGSRARTSDSMQIGNFKKEENSGDIWIFRGNENVNTALTVTATGALSLLMQQTNKKDKRPVIDLSDDDPAIPLSRTNLVAENAVVNALQSANFNIRAPLRGLYPARSAVAEYLSQDLPYKISPSDVYITAGFRQALEVIATVIAAPGANILLPRPGFPNYAAQFKIGCLEVRYYNLLPHRNWEIDLDALEVLADENTSAIVISNPGNPCGSLFSNDHLKKIAESARRLGILVISDEVYAQFTFGSEPFVPMATFGSIAPVITLGSISRKWVVPGWRLGWLVTCDPHGNLQKSGIVQHISACLRIISPPVTFLQAALPKILQEREGTFFLQHMNALRQSLDLLYNKIREIACFTWSQKPAGATCGMVKLDLSLLEGIEDDIDFCLKLAREESVLILPGLLVGMKNWICLSFALGLSTLEDGLGRVRSFCQRHAKQGARNKF